MRITMYQKTPFKMNVALKKFRFHAVLLTKMTATACIIFLPLISRFCDKKRLMNVRSCYQHLYRHASYISVRITRMRTCL